MCGSLRKRLHNIDDRDPDDPALYWPDCLIPKPNDAPKENSETGKTLEECFTACKEASKDICKYWSHDSKDGSCNFHKILRTEHMKESETVISGDKYCVGTLRLPHCAEKNKNYTSEILGEKEAVGSMEECSQRCQKYVNDTCENWFYVEDSSDGSKTCEIRGKTEGAAIDHKDNTTTVYFGSKSCIKGKKEPALPEDAEALEYIEVCQDNQYKEEIKTNNTWDIDYCPSIYLCLVN